MQNLAYVGAVFALVLIAMDWTGLLGKRVGQGYCSLRHPVEAAGPVRRTACESQHVIQRQAGGSDERNTIWINGVEHIYLDLSADQPWERERPWSGALVDHNAERAYMMGVYANGFHFATYDHHGEGHATITQWDGVSHLTYGVASAFNFVTKELSYLGYQVERGGNDQQTQWIDAVLGVLIDLVEVLIGLGYCVVGVVVGTVLNPVDTIVNVPGGILLVLEAVVEGFANTISDLVSLLTLGWIEV